MKNIFLFVICFTFFNCTKEINTQEFISQYNYSIELPQDWSEFKSAEKEEETDIFANNSDWTGNLRITPIPHPIENPEEYIDNEIAEIGGEKFEWDGIIGLKYTVADQDEFVYLWHFIENNRLYICSFTIDSNSLDTEENKAELDKVISILKSIKTIKK